MVMSNLYTVKDTTLTALGDAIRKKVIGISKTPAPINKDNVSLNPYNFEVIEFPSGIKTVKVIGHINEYGSSISGNTVLYTLGYASGAYTRERDIRSATDFTIINPNWDGAGYDFEITVKGNAISFTTGQGYNSWGASSTYDYTAVGLDENGNEFKYTPLEMVDKINELEVPNIQPIVLTDNQTYGCSGSLAGKYIDNFGDTITTQNITNAKYMFYSNPIKTIPFELNMNIEDTSTDTSYMFSVCEYLEQAPIINNLRVYKAMNMFYGCNRLRSFPDGFGENWEYSTINNSTQDISYVFYNCYSLRQLPMVLRKNLWNKGSSYYTLYYQGFTNCYSLDEITELSVSPATLTSNSFNNTFNCCCRLKDLIFAVNEDGTPKTANWKKQTIIASSIGSSLSLQVSYILNYNSGITADKQVKDDATYQALKNDPDWFSAKVEYSRYNHDSAVRTINSLPDCSAYLATQTGTSNTNTIKFDGKAGALTDGGAINTLTEEEIAVAAAKGWTVTLS